MLEIQLSTDKHPNRRYIQIATCPSMQIERRASKHGIIDELARKLIEAGADPAETVKIIRNGKPVFKNEWPLSKWAGLRLTENDKRIKWERFRERPEFVSRSNHTGRFEVSEVSTYLQSKEAAE